MAPPKLTPTSRYYPPGIRKVYWMPVTANWNAPTRTEINAGTDLSGEVNAMAGWSITSAPVETPDMGSRFVSQVPGALTSQTNSLTLYKSQNGQDARLLLVRDLNGYIIVLWEGDVSGQYMDVFPVRVMSQAPDATVTDPGKTEFQFAITALPATEILIP